jgi:hypothetical protein
MPENDSTSKSFPINHFSDSRSSGLLEVGGGLALAGIVIGLAILILCCGGFDGALTFSLLPILTGTAGGVLSFIATWRAREISDSAVLAAFFMALLAVLGGLLEAAAWLHWPILFSQSM